jgi:hypothetical protein
MPRLAPGNHEFLALPPKEVVDGRDEPGHDAGRRPFILLVRLPRATFLHETSKEEVARGA